jgi:cytochrome P450
VLGNIPWHVTQDKEIEKRLLKELRARMGKEEDVGSASLDGDGFEYLKAVVKEGLSLSYEVPGRLIRRAPKEGAKFGETWVPGGVSDIVYALKFGLLTSRQAVVTSGIYLQNTDPAVFPDPFKFIPERWLCDA